jgi:Zn-dependent protease with chaperone function
MVPQAGVAARYFDGRSTAAHLVSIVIRSGRVVVTGPGVERNEPLEAVEILPALGRTPRLVRFPGGASCEVADSPAFAAMLAADGMAGPALSKWERSWTLALASVGIVALAAVLTYVYGLPAAAAGVANRLPLSALDVLSTHTLWALDARWLDPSQLDAVRRSDLAGQFQRMRWPSAPARPLALQFRRSETLGANAFALPSGLIVVTDDLVSLVADDRELLAILAHEVAHVDQRHGVRSMLQASALTLLVTWYVGDISALAVAAPTALLQTRYSRSFERDADGYAVRALQLNDISSRHFADVLSRIQAVADREGHIALPYLSTHPATADRVARLREPQEGGP